MKAMLTAAALLVAAIPFQARADEIEEALKAALEAYQAGDLNAAKEEVDFASQLMAQMKAAGLGDFLPAPLEGWTRLEGRDQTQAMAAFGGGLSASAAYERGQDRVEIQFMADNQMVTAMGAMFGNATLLGTMGQVKRINRQMVVVTKQGEVQALVDNRILIQISGSAPVEDKEAYFGAIDLKGLTAF